MLSCSLDALRLQFLCPTGYSGTGQPGCHVLGRCALRRALHSATCRWPCMHGLQARMHYQHQQSVRAPGRPAYGSCAARRALSPACLIEKQTVDMAE